MVYLPTLLQKEEKKTVALSQENASIHVRGTLSFKFTENGPKLPETCFYRVYLLFAELLKYTAKTRLSPVSFFMDCRIYLATLTYFNDKKRRRELSTKEYKK